jgi:hypothetical protein
MRESERERGRESGDAEGGLVEAHRRVPQNLTAAFKHGAVHLHHTQQSERERERGSYSVSVCVCEREREASAAGCPCGGCGVGVIS